MPNKQFDAWTDMNTTLWLIGAEYPIPLFTCAIEKLSIKNEDRPYWICSHCGKFSKGGIACTGCNAPRKGAETGCGFVSIQGLLPHSKDIAELERDFELQLVYVECGRADVDKNGQAILIMKNCKIREKWISGFGSLAFMDGMDFVEEMLMLHILVSCDITLNFEPTEGVIFDWSEVKNETT